MNIKQCLQSFDAGDLLMVEILLAAVIPGMVYVMIATLIYMIGNFVYCRWKLKK